MLGARLIRPFKLPKTRQLNTTSMKGNKSVTNDPLPKSNTQEVSEHISKLGVSMQNVSKLDKMILVWVKRYPSMDQVPSRVSLDCIRQAHTKTRIRICNIMIVFTILGFIGASISGKKEVASGKHILTERLKWMDEQKEKGRVEDAAAAVAAATAEK